MLRPALLLSLHGHHAQAILRGDKRVELRRRPPRCALPADVLMYATQPHGAVLGRCRFDALISSPPHDLWGTVGRRAGVTRDEFDAYFSGSATAHALVIADARPTVRTSLAFRTPQSFRYLRAEIPEHRPLLELLACRDPIVGVSA